MTKLPMSLRWLGLFNAGVALSLPVQIMVIYGHSIAEWQAVAAKLTVLNWMVMLGTMVNAVMILRAERWTLYLTPMMFALVGFNNFLVALYAIDFAPWMTGAAFFSFLFLHMPLVTESNLRLLKNPSLRWWRTPERHRKVVPITLGDVHGRTVISTTFDISETGVFIPLNEEQMNRQAEMEDVRVLMDLGSAHFRCSAQVARRTMGGGKYPSGIGVRFTDLSPRERAQLRKVLDQ